MAISEELLEEFAVALLLPLASQLLVPLALELCDPLAFLVLEPLEFQPLEPLALALCDPPTVKFEAELLSSVEVNVPSLDREPVAVVVKVSVSTR
ncbi:hypothetical protein D3C81_1168970 [compost metagenome]